MKGKKKINKRTDTFQFLWAHLYVGQMKTNLKIPGHNPPNQFGLHYISGGHDLQFHTPPKNNTNATRYGRGT